MLHCVSGVMADNMMIPTARRLADIDDALADLAVQRKALTKMRTDLLSALAVFSTDPSQIGFTLDGQTRDPLAMSLIAKQ